LAQSAIRRLNALRPLSHRALNLLEQAIQERKKYASVGEDLVCEGDRIDSVRIVLSGWLCRYKTLEDGRRQIVNFALPGDTCDAHIYLLSSMDHSIATLTSVTYAEIPRTAFEKLIGSDGSLAEAFWCETVVNSAMQREWTVNVGRRTALERVAHMLCEIFERLQVVGMIEGNNTCTFPVTQMDMADATGLSIVHVNRTLQELRNSGLIKLRDRFLTIGDLSALHATALFSPDYLYTKRQADRVSDPNRTER
jgi:CRP-like cAMP-binding protein